MARIELRDITLEYPIIGGHQRLLRKVLFSRRTGGSVQRREGHQHSLVVRAIRCLSLTIKDGDRLGLIGPNGAGKSTLLRVIAGIYHPGSGSVVVEGNVSAMFNPGLGLDLDDTGMENIGSIGLHLGMSRREIRQKINEIAEFSELGEFLHLPVRTYSSGMQVRLAFAVATSIEPEILLLDEALSAGDARFADRARQRFDSLIGRTRILVLASHSNDLIRSLCNKALLLSQGEAIAVGPVDEVIDAYGRMAV